jgi:protein phosphatase 2C family protein 2/3
VLPGRLAVSRAFGDFEAKLPHYGGKQGVVIAEPEVIAFEIQENVDDFILLGCKSTILNQRRWHLR